MPTPPETINLQPAASPGAPSTITLSAASASSAPGGITLGGTRGVTVSGTLTPDATGFLMQAGEAAGYPYYSTDGSPTPPAVGTYVLVARISNRWQMGRYVDNVLTGSWQANVGTEATPDLATGWAPISGGPSESGTPTFTLSGTAVVAPSTITRSAASAPGATSTITLTAASAPGAPGTITPS